MSVHEAPPSPPRPGDAAAGPDAAPAPTLHEPAGGIPSICQDREELRHVCEGFAGGTGPIALDAERASGHRYGQRAFLVQAKREGSGIALIDTAALPDLSDFGASISTDEWILHSATQDLTCLSEVGLRPTRLFDTELAARLLNLPRVGLASLTESLLGWHLAKGHSAADWSIRPLPRDYLRYAALDVELLIELRHLLEGRLRDAGKWEWAEQEFAALVDWSPNVHAEPWRRTSGSHKLRKPQNLAVLRSLWEARDSLAASLDVAPGRVLPDSALVAAAEAMPAEKSALLDVPGFKRQQRRLGVWWQAVRDAVDLPASQLPALRAPTDGPPPPRSWSGKDPDAAQRFNHCRGAVLALAHEHDLPAEVLISPDAIRRVAWTPPSPVDAASVSAFLTARGVRAWQVDIVAGELAAALVR